MTHFVDLKQHQANPDQLELLSPTRHSSSSCSDASPCQRCKADQRLLRRKTKPPSAADGRAIRIADLFCGCGGMTLGMVEAARSIGRSSRIVLALDSDPDVIEIYRRNFADADVRSEDVGRVFDGALGQRLTEAERKVAKKVGRVDILVGGPPCQGHSDLNNHTRRNDPKNALYLRMARAVEVLRPKIAIIENVPPVQWDKTDVVRSTSATLMSCGYRVASRVIDLRMVGVPQRRRRFVLLAWQFNGADPEDALDKLTSEWGTHPYRTVRWAVADLLQVQNETTFDTASRPTAENTRRMEFLFKNDRHDLPNSERPKCHRDGNHSYNSVYGRLYWNQPAQTITTGFGCMGQGRYVHPEQRRTITPHEAARLQTFPDWFDFGTETRRGVLAKSIGNAVPPFMMLELGKRILLLLSKKHQRAS